MNLKNVLLLIRAYFSGTKMFSQFSMGNQSQRRKTIFSKIGGTTGKVFLGIILGFSFLTILVMVGINLYAMEMLGRQLVGRPGFAVLLANTLSFILLLVFGFMMCTDVLYKGKDLAIIMTMPISESEIIISRFFIIVINMMPFHLAVMIPALISEYILGPFSIAMISGSIINLLLTPFIPICVACLLTMLSCRLGGKGPGKFAFQIAFMLALFALLGVFQSSTMDSMGSMMSVEQMADVNVVFGFLVKAMDILYKYLVLFVWQSDTLFAQSALVGSLISLAIIAIVILISSFLISRSYNLVVSNFFGGGVSKKKKREITDKNYKQRSVVGTLMLREWEILKGSSSFLFEIGGEILIPIILIALYSIMGVIDQMATSMGGLIDSPLAPFVMLGLLCLFALFDQITCTSASREGKMFAYNQVFPIEPKTYVQAKMGVHMIAVFGSDLIYSIVLVIFFKLKIIYLGLFVSVLLLFTSFCGYVGLAFDLGKPFLIWKNPQQAVKNNLNGLKSMGVCFGLVAIEAGLFCLLLFKLSLIFAVVSIYVVFAIYVIVARKLAYNSAIKVYS